MISAGHLHVAELEGDAAQMMMNAKPMGKMMLAAMTTLLAAAPMGALAQQYSVQTKWTVGGDGGWDYLAVDPSAPQLYLTHGQRVDAATKTVVETIPLPGKPEFPTADGMGAVFVNIEDKNVIVKLDAATKTAVATWPLTGCDSPSEMAIDALSPKLLYVAKSHDKKGSGAGRRQAPHHVDR